MALSLAAAGCVPAVGPPAPPPSLGVAEPRDETGAPPDRLAMVTLRAALVAALRARGIDAEADGLGRATTELRLTLVQRRGPGLETPALHEGALMVASLHERGSNGTRITVAATAPGVPAAPGEAEASVLAEAAASAVAPLLLGRPPAARDGADITATGRRVRHLGQGVLAVGEDRVDLRAVRHGHDPIADPDVPVATDITLADAATVSAASPGEAVITLYQIDPPLTGLPSRQPGIDRSIDFRNPADLVKSAYANAVSVVRTEDAAPVAVANHPIGHFVVKLEVPGYPPVLTGMTTIHRSDAELVDLTIRRELGIGGILLTPQPGRLNAASEVARELALRQRQLRVVDGLYFRPEGGRNTGPEYLLDAGNVVFARIRVPERNATDALAYLAEFVARGGHNRFGSLLNRPFRGTGAGCSAFAMSLLQAAGVIPFVTEPTPGPRPEAPEAFGPLDFWRAMHSQVRIPWAHIGCDERVGAARSVAAQYTIYDLLLHGERPEFVTAATVGLAEHVRGRFGVMATTIFDVGVQTPLRNIAVAIHRRDPLDRGTYAWGGEGIDIPFWENARFSAWVRGLWRSSPRHPGIRLARQGRFRGLDIDAMAAPRQQEPFFAAADRREEALRRPWPPAMTCAAAFARGLE